MDDQTFLHAFEGQHLPQFTHQDHLRMAWLYLRGHGWENGLAKVRSGLITFANAHGVPQKYHETITCFWAWAVYQALQLAPEIETFDLFIERYAHLLQGNLMTEHYSADLLRDPKARQSWVAPDVMPLPGTAFSTQVVLGE